MLEEISAGFCQFLCKIIEMSIVEQACIESGT